MDTTEERHIAGEDFRHDLMEVRRRASAAARWSRERDLGGVVGMGLQATEAKALVRRGLAALAVVEAAEAAVEAVETSHPMGEWRAKHEALVAALAAWHTGAGE